MREELTVCNLCGRKMDMLDTSNGICIYDMMGYGSKYDGERIYLKLCCTCADKLIDSCRVTPIIYKRDTYALSN